MIKGCHRNHWHAFFDIVTLCLFCGPFCASCNGFLFEHLTVHGLIEIAAGRPIPFVKHSRKQAEANAETRLSGRNNNHRQRTVLRGLRVGTSEVQKRAPIFLRTIHRAIPAVEVGPDEVTYRVLRTPYDSRVRVAFRVARSTGRPLFFDYSKNARTMWKGPCSCGAHRLRRRESDRFQSEGPVLSLV